MCPSSGLWGVVLDCDFQFTILNPLLFDGPQLWRSTSVDSSLYLLNLRPPPRVRKTDTLIVFDLFVLHSVMCLKTCHFTACFTSLWTSISVFYVNTARDVVTGLLIFAKFLLLYLRIFTCTHRGKHTQTHMYHQQTRGLATTRHRSLVERGGRKALLQTLQTQKKEMSEKNRHSRI